VPERILDPSDEPAVLFGNGRELGGACRNRLSCDQPRIVDDEQQAHVLLAAVHPETRIAERELATISSSPTRCSSTAPNAAL